MDSASEDSDEDDVLGDDVLGIEDDVFDGGRPTDSQSEHERLPLRENEIRIVRLQLPDPASATTIRCRTTIVSLDARPQYVALSYAWGLPPAQHIINIDGHDFMVRKNIYRFFDQLSRTPRNWPSMPALWIDSICIDQTNSNEVTQQIGLMSRIFSGAQKVVVWLGPRHSDSDVAMRALAEYASYQHNRRRCARFWNSPGGLAVTRLCRRMYWTRLWIIQELMLAKDTCLLCGDMSIAWTDFCNVLQSNERVSQSRNDRNRDYEIVSRSPAMSIVKQSQQGLQRTLWDLMSQNYDLECADQKDKIFALLGIAKVDPLLAIQPDYQMPLRCLLNKVLRLRHSEDKPMRIEDVISDCDSLADMFGLDQTFFFARQHEDGRYEDLELSEPETCPMGDPGSEGITLWWALFYDHQDILVLMGFEVGEGLNAVFMSTWIWAVEREELSAISFLLQSGWIDPAWHCFQNSYPPFGHRQLNALEASCELGNLEIVKTLLNSGLDIDQSDQAETQPAALWIAADKGHMEILRLLIGCDYVMKNKNRSVSDAFHDACYRGHEEVMECLLDAGADFRQVGSRIGWHGYALQAACMSKRLDLGVVRRLLERGADVNAVDGDWDTPLQVASGRNSGKIDLVKLLLEHGAEVNALGGMHGNALQAAYAGDNDDVVQLLLEWGADPGKEGGPYVHWLARAAGSGNHAICKLLLEKGADVNALGGVYGTPLEAACASGRTSVVRLLLQAGADVHQVGAAGTPLQVAAQRGRHELVQLLLGRGAEVNVEGGRKGNALQGACARRKSGNERVVQLLLESGADPNSRGKVSPNLRDRPPWASDDGSDRVTAEACLTTPLQKAASSGSREMAALLLKYGADVNAQGGEPACTALGTAARLGDRKLVRSFLQAGAKVNIQVNAGYRNALHAARECGYESTARLLIKAGARDGDLEGWNCSEWYELPSSLDERTWAGLEYSH